ncbi:unnamed protein product [Parascedosporium putredinis]|uniref:Uncharacterized protein n=1 Tax=Parascedosporium putredinis TaxID=1442378 RepID=A0A9P1H822_9PEZI|nr:unnamed protein product [Parascedosporium putredinis]CAI8001795.1 unnamed protein product [Parascedosporium putredinis]
MERRMDGSMLSLRLKHGVHTIFLFVDALEPFSSLDAQLLEVLRERYADGYLTTSQGSTPIPSGDATVYYARLKNSVDPSEGWKRLDVLGKDTPSKKGIADNSVLAFAIYEEGQEPDEVEFLVDWPSLDDYEEEDAEGNGYES